MKQTLIVTLSALLALTAWADSPHFTRGPDASFDATSGDYCVSFTENGLGNTPITYTLSFANTVSTWQCFTKSGGEPQGDPNSVSDSNVVVQNTITPRNGRIRATLCASPDQDGAHCQGHGLVLRLISALYSGVTFCDSTNNVCVSMPNLGGGVQ